MKRLYTLIILIPVMLFAFTSRVQASTPGLPEDDFSCGDVNEDGLVNVLDIITMVNYIMGSNPSPFNMDAADINADEGINVLDIIALVNIIMQVPGMPCGCVAPVLYEGQTYTTVQIGGQCWFKENMNVGTMIVGTIEQSNNGTIEKYFYDNNPSNCGIYGGLYQWNEAMQYVTTEGVQGICPDGWHIPTDNEWKILEGTVDSQYPVGDPEWELTGWRGFDAGGNLKETGFTHWLSPNTGANNSSGFTCLPGGSSEDGAFYSLGSY
ncbi:MAG: FISUMP domain-containing protein [Bacteroidales bacterium]|nr:FISUMP domain-containing protein [Bacteroidales bacterium]